MTCAECGMTVMWDCECDPELNALIEDGLRREREAGASSEQGEGA